MNRVTGPLLVIAGPTASGKSLLARDIATAVGGVVINADSMQLYADLPILTDQPSPAEKARIAHRLYGILDASQPCSAGRWRELARREVEAVWAGGGVPVLTGGSGLYLRGFFGGLATIPAIPQAIRSQAIALRDHLGPEEFHRRLAERDRQSAARLHVHDTQRVTRAWEVVEATGIPLSQWQCQTELPDAPPALAIILAPEKESLDAAIAERFSSMLERGVLTEVKQFLDRDLSSSLPIMKALGLRQLACHIRQECGLETALEEAITATRRYAKRQKTWFRNQSFGLHVTIRELKKKYSEKEKAEICSLITKKLLTPQPGFV